MAATEYMHAVRSMNPQEQAIAMAVAVLVDRLQKLSAEDREDLLALVKELAGATTEEERCQITDTMLEIFECRPSAIEALELDGGEPPAAMKKWTDYVAKKVKEARELARLTQEQLSQRTGLPQSHISRIENARLSPSRMTLEKIASALGKSLADFDFDADRSSDN